MASQWGYAHDNGSITTHTVLSVSADHWSNLGETDSDQLPEQLGKVSNQSNIHQSLFS